MLTCAQVEDEDLTRGAELVVLRVEERDEVAALTRAAGVLRRRGLGVGWWIEVARSPSIADAHPERMASLQGHDEWRVLFPDSAAPKPDEVVKVHPWVPITTREGFDAQLARVAALLDALPAADEVYLNDLQAAPSACGCGHPQCRWTADYFLRAEGREEPQLSGTPLGPRAAADFVAALEPHAKGAVRIPVWMAECGRGDPRCHGVGCYDGACWRELAKQWAPVVEACPRLAVFVPAAGADDVRAAVASLTAIDRPDAPSVSVDPSRIVRLTILAPIEQGWTPRRTPRGR